MTKPAVIRDQHGRPFSKWKPVEKFEYMFQEQYFDLYEYVETDYQFDKDRKWAFDYAWPSLMLAVEIDGMGVGGFGRHQQAQGQAQDNEKINVATASGWKVLRYNSRQLGSKQGVIDAVEQVVECLIAWD